LVQGGERNEYYKQSMGINELQSQTNKPLISMVNKWITEKNEPVFIGESVFNISATTGEGFERLLAQLGHYAERFLAGSEPALVTRERHRRALEEMLAALRRALADDLASHEDLVAEELRIAARALGRLTGRVDVEDILDVIFRDFCIGK
jgi:tRNA U34 5-carboxymethylaminomethyl modifying GTPase MnmE/TrmE